MIVDMNEIIVVKDWWDEFGTSVLICPCVEKHGIHCAATLSGNSDFVVATQVESYILALLNGAEM